MCRPSSRQRSWAGRRRRARRLRASGPRGALRAPAWARAPGARPRRPRALRRPGPPARARVATSASTAPDPLTVQRRVTAPPRARSPHRRSSRAAAADHAPGSARRAPGLLAARRPATAGAPVLRHQGRPWRQSRAHPHATRTRGVLSAARRARTRTPRCRRADRPLAARLLGAHVGRRAEHETGALVMGRGDRPRRCHQGPPAARGRSRAPSRPRP